MPDLPTVDLITTPLVTDPDDVLEVGVQVFKARYPTWDDSASTDFTMAMLSSFAAMVAYTGTQSTNALTELIKFFGLIQGLPPLDAQPATVASTWVLSDDDGHTITAGTLVGIDPGDGGDLVAFAVQEDVVVDSGMTTTGVGEVILVAEEPGAAGTGLTGPADVLDSVSFVDPGAVTLTGPTVGGQDAEATIPYLTRYTKFALLLTPKPIVAADVVLLAQVLFPRVQRALAADMYNADTDTSDEERCYTLFPVGPLGEALSTDEKTEILDRLQALRESTFLFFVEDPEYTEVDAVCVGVAEPGYDTDDVETRVAQALTDLTSPARHGIPNRGDATQWVNRTKIYFQDAVAAVNNVEGFDRYTTLTLNGGTADVTLTGVAPLPTTGTISVTVSAP